MFLTFWIFLTFLTFHFGARNQAPEAQGTRGGRFLKEPGARTGPDSSPVALVPSKNPFRQSLIGEKLVLSGQSGSHDRISHVLSLKRLNLYFNLDKIVEMTYIL